MTEKHTSKHPLRAKFDELNLPKDPDHRSNCAENRTRLGRAISWLECHAETPEDKPDERFLFLWISFNAAYGADDPIKGGAHSIGDLKKLQDFFHLIVERDKSKRLAEFMRAHESNLCKIMEIRFLLKDFWRGEYSTGKNAAWEKRYEDDKVYVGRALKNICSGRGRNSDCVKVLQCVFNRLYTLRNQIFHGSAEWRGKYNRSSLSAGNAILGACIPVILEIMLEETAKDPETFWGGRVAYPPYLPKPDDDESNDPPSRGYWQS